MTRLQIRPYIVSSNAVESHKPLRILMVANGTPGVPPKTSGGLELVIFYLVKWLSHLGHVVTLVDTASNEERDNNVDIAFCKIIKIRHFNLARFHRRKTNYVMHELLRQLSMLSFSLKLLGIAPKILLSARYDVIHVHYRCPFLALWTAKNLLRIKIPIVFHCHNAWMTREGIPLLLRFFWFFDIIAVRKADRIIALSRPVKRGLIRFYHAPKEKIVVIPNGVELPRFKKTLNIDQVNGVTIVCIANIVPMKNQEILIYALSQLCKQFPNVRLMLVGEIVDKEYYRKLYLKVMELKLTKNVYFIGGVSHRKVWKFLETSDVTVLPSRFEAMSMAALECLASGTPTLLSRIPSFTNMCEEGAALFFNPYNASELVEGLLRIITDRKFREELSSKATEFVASRYSWHAIVMKVEELYVNLYSLKCPIYGEK